MKTSIPFLLALASLSSLGLSCNSLECGEGTIEEDGVCVGVIGPETGNCGPGTTLDSVTGQCTPDYCEDGEPNANCGHCADNSEPVPDPVTGVLTCRGGGGTDDCTPGEIICPTPGTGKFMACGAIVDVGTSAVVANPDAFKVLFYDALKFAQSTPDNRPDPLGEGTINACGQFASNGGNNAMGITPATFVAIAIDDKVESAGIYALTGVGVAASANTSATVNGHATRELTVDAWEASTGVSDLVGKGVLLPIYLSEDAEVKLDDFFFEGAAVGPIEGVDVVGPAGQTFYFADTDRAQRLMPVAGDGTGVSGSALLLNAPIDDYSGSGPAGCEWNVALGGSNAGVVFIAERHHIGSGECQ
jgi:hypothetical protein